MTVQDGNTATLLRCRVDGMDCPSCASKIETAVKRLGGTDVRVSYQRQTLALHLDEVATPRAAVEEGIRKLGYGVAPVAAPTVEVGGAGFADAVAPARPTWWRGATARLAAMIGILIALGFLASHAVAGLGDREYLPAALVGLAFFGRKALAAARAGSLLSIEMLMSIAVAGAVAIGAESEAATVAFLFTVGELLEGVAGSRARAGIEALGKLVPRTAMLLEGGTAREVAAASLNVDDVVLVRPGDRLPADGVVVEGVSEVDESTVTGE